MKLATLFAACTLVACAVTATAQEKRIETRTTETDVDSLGDGKVVRSETFTSLSTTEDMTVKNHMIALDPVKFFTLFNIGYQHAITPQITVGGSVQATTQLVQAEGWGIAAEGRFYPDGHPFRSFHVDASLGYNDITTEEHSYEYETGKESTETIQIAPVTAGVKIGWHWYPWKDLAVDAALGADYNFGGDPDSRELWNSSLPFMSAAHGITPSVRINIGYAW